MFFIYSWDISETLPLEGPYNTSEDAKEKIADSRDDYLECVMVIGPIPVVYLETPEIAL